jgi:hypothetical protein
VSREECSGNHGVAPAWQSKRQQERLRNVTSTLFDAIIESITSLNGETDGRAGEHRTL